MQALLANQDFYIVCLSLLFDEDTKKFVKFTELWGQFELKDGLAGSGKLLAYSLDHLLKGETVSFHKNSRIWPMTWGIQSDFHDKQPGQGWLARLSGKRESPGL